MIRDIEKFVRDNRVIAIIRGQDTDTCLKLAEACAKGGIRMTEVTFVQKDPTRWHETADSIRAIRARFGSDLRVGAGTVLNAEQLKMTCDAGGEYMIAPNVNPGLIRAATAAGLATMPGALTPSEAVQAWEAGATFVKIFPAGTMGVKYVKDLLAPLAHIPMLAVGGITPDNIADFMKAGCVGAGVSGKLVNKELIAAGAWDKIADVARELMARSQV